MLAPPFAGRRWPARGGRSSLRPGVANAGHEETAMPRPLSKDDLAVLRTVARGQPSDYPPDEATMARLTKGGLISQPRARWPVPEKGRAELDRRKVPAPDPAVAPEPPAG